MWSLPLISYAASRGYYYIGPCWSGIGPFAFYVTPDGRIVHAWQLFGLPFLPWLGPLAPAAAPASGLAPAAAPASERGALEREREALRRELEYIEKRLRELGAGEG